MSQVLFGCGGENAVDRHIIGPISLGLNGLPHSLDGDPDNDISAQYFSGFLEGHIFLTEVKPIGSDRFCNLHRVVDDQERVVSAGQLQSFRSHFDEILYRQSFLSYLYNFYPTLKRESHLFKHGIPLMQTGIGD